jgi:hypothetical protein
MVNGLHINLAPRPATAGYQEDILQDPKPLLIKGNVSARLKEKKLDHSDYMPYSLLAVPLITGDHATGVLSVYDFQNEDAFDQIHVELLSSIAAQLATALENTKLFNDVKRALNQIENRQRIQNFVTNAVADLSLKGSKNIKAFLSSLAEATRCERIHYAEGQTNPEGDFFWRAVEVWHAEEDSLFLMISQSKRSDLKNIPNGSRISVPKVGMRFHWLRQKVKRKTSCPRKGCNRCCCWALNPKTLPSAT